MMEAIMYEGIKKASPDHPKKYPLQSAINVEGVIARAILNAEHEYIILHS